MNTFPLPTIMLADAQRNALSARIAAETYPLNGPFAPYIARTGAAVSAVLEDGQRRMLADLPHLGALVIDNVPVDANVLSGPIDPLLALKGLEYVVLAENELTSTVPARPTT